MDKDLAEFIESSFESVWSLELLLALYRQPDRMWTSEELIAELRSSQLVVGKSIETLLASGLAVAESGDAVRYGPASADQAGLVARLDEEYRIKPAAVRGLIVRSPANKLKVFANAFKILKD